MAYKRHGREIADGVFAESNKINSDKLFPAGSRILIMISIIIPTYNESAGIQSLVQYLLLHGGGLLTDIIVVDGGSSDNTIQLAAEAGAKTVTSPGKGRAAQMNYGASLSEGEVLYFIHADVFPPASFAKDIIGAVQEGYGLGRYRTTFNSRKWYLRFNAFFTRFDWFVCYGGDQTLFIRKDLFEANAGFQDDMHIMEEYEFIVRVRKQKPRYKIFTKGALVSARKYDQNSWWRVQRANYTIIKMYKKGASQNEMVKRYKEMLQYR